jgi:hypothetical protein
MSDLCRWLANNGTEVSPFMGDAILLNRSIQYAGPAWALRRRLSTIVRGRVRFRNTTKIGLQGSAVILDRRASRRWFWSPRTHGCQNSGPEYHAGGARISLLLFSLRRYDTGSSLYFCMKVQEGHTAVITRLLYNDRRVGRSELNEPTRRKSSDVIDMHRTLSGKP